MSTIVVFVLKLILGASLPSGSARITIADGSVWGDGLRGGEVCTTTRLADVDPATRWLAADVDGDGLADLVAVRRDGFAIRVDIFRQTPDGFVKGGGVAMSRGWFAAGGVSSIIGA